jgi:DNA repair exonuclease SbcCD ATPase subunit
MYFVVACAAEGVTLPRLPSLSLFDDGEQSLYRDYERALLAEKRLYWDELDARNIAQQRLDQAIAVSNELGSARQREEALAARVPQLESELARCAREFTRVDTELVQARRAHREAADECGQMRERLLYRESARGWLRWPLMRARQLIGGRPS